MAKLFMDLTDKALELRQKADAGDAEAQYYFAIYLLKEPDYSYRENLSPEEVERGLHYLQLSAAQGYFHGIAADEVGTIYYYGELVPRDYQKAKTWFATAELKGIPTATHMLGECAYYGYDEDVDFAKAVKYYIKAAPTYVNAVIRLGDMYQRGEYLPLDPAFAKELFEYVRVSEEWLYKKNRLYSDANDMVINRLIEIGSTNFTHASAPLNETEEQSKVRRILQKVMERDRKQWDKWSRES